MLNENPELELRIIVHGSKAAHAAAVTSVVALTAEQLLHNTLTTTIPDSAAVLITDVTQVTLKGQILEALDLILGQMHREGCGVLIISALSETRQHIPKELVERAARLEVPILTTTAPIHCWDALHEDILQARLALAESKAAQLNSLIQKIPVQLTDARAMQRIADWVAQTLECQVLVSEPERVLAASPATATEHLARAIIRQAVDGALAETLTGSHTQLISLAPATGTETVLAVARETPFSETDLPLLQHAAKLLGLIHQAYREYRAASAASQGVRRAVVELLLNGELAKARHVMANLAPGLLEAETARVFVVETPQERRDATVSRCHATIGWQVLAVSDPKDVRKVLIVHPIRRDEDTGAEISAKLTRLVATLGISSSLGGSSVYSMALVAEALREASIAQKFAALQPGSVALSVHDSDLLSLLPQAESQNWAHNLLQPLMRDQVLWESMRETLPTALAYPYTEAGRRLFLHRNTVTRRVSRAAELLHMEFTSINNRIAVHLAMGLIAQRKFSSIQHLCGSEPVSLTALLDTPHIHDWARTLVKPMQNDRRDLMTTALTWLAFDTHAERAARSLGISKVTLRSHLRAVEKYLQRDLGSLTGVRDLQFSLHIVTGKPRLHSYRQDPSGIAC
ncbi:helix-turn-helix domain-containing protein [Streptomyces sp. NPDC020707]|uniref:helix-turn-helix domain-containing protein n=1 Tax=Streptomyces sp. NPDC020707 TaxID=3365084 RepID=UPI0037B67171